MAIRYSPVDDVVNSGALGQMDSPNFTFVYDFEKLSTGLEEDFRAWTERNWHYTVYISAIYVALVFYGQRYMKNRPPFNLRPMLAAWSGILAIFSIMGAYRTLPELIHTWQNYSFHHTICHPNYFYGVTGFWSICFVLSKAYELGDTAFIVLRKQNLMFLHWYHHITVLMYVFQSYSEHTAPGRWFFAMNYTVHAFMYSYYALRAMQFRPPRWTSMCITSMQIVQMIIGCLVFAYVQWTKRAGLPCQVSDANALSGSIMYLSYFLLFANFFYHSYMKPSARRSTATTAAAAGSGGSGSNSSEQHTKQPDVAAVLKSVASMERHGFVAKKEK
ncbi:hypothetical protein BOX15_Mlig027938g2 [Macrostomum lignano]|uniref:Elongation of very long chain fatty acids protein n=2 Tax=Macrostomum lignano TaxID=282301 RepID=A0A1I8FXJ4_9PLAT|nr:hypothetical protein BOX15_Mlig027938g2 [Macrostomum lignano]